LHKYSGRENCGASLGKKRGDTRYVITVIARKGGKLQLMYRKCGYRKRLPCYIDMRYDWIDELLIGKKSMISNETQMTVVLHPSGWEMKTIKTGNL